MKEPITEVVMDDAGNDVSRDDYQPQDTSEAKTRKTLNPEWFKQPPRPPTLDLECNKRQVVLDQLAQPWFNQMVSALKNPLTFNDLMVTLIDFSNIELKYNFQEWFNALTDKLDCNNLEGDRYPFDLSKHLPLQGPLEVTYTTSITKTKAARYEIKGIEDMVPTLWSTIKHVFKEGDFDDLHLNNIEDMLLLAVQHKLFHLDGNVIIDFIVALRMFTRSLILKRRVEDLQLARDECREFTRREKHNITITLGRAFLDIECKEPYTQLYDPPGIVYEDLYKQKRVLRVDELYKFSNGTLKSVCDEIHHRVLDFHLDYNPDMPKRKWMTVD
ncbi:hypothetical protein Tco_0340788 [Tanacetum coccineum]